MAVVQNSGTLRVDNFGGGAASVNNTTAVASNFTAGNGAIVAIGHYGNSPARQVTALSVGGTAGTLVVRRDNSDIGAEIWVVENMTGGNRTVSMDLDTGTGQYITYSVIEVDNLDTSPADQVGTGGPTNSAAPSATTAAAGDQADELFVAVYYDGTGVVQSTITPPSGYTAMHAELDGSSFVGSGAAYKISSSANSAAETAAFSLTSAVTWDTAIAGFRLVTGGAATADQEGFRFRNDDGSETSATWAASQDTDKTAPLSANLRLRLLIDGTNDLASAAYTLRYQKNGSGGYVAVPVGATVPEVYGTATYGAIGTGANGSTTVAPTYPTGITAGQYLVLVVTSGSTGDATPATPSGWTFLATGASTDGTYGVDAGPRRVTAFGKEATGSESGTVTVSITGGGTCRGTITRFTKAGSGSWVIEAQGANDSTSGTGVSMTFASMNFNTGDAVLVATGQRVDSATQASQSLTASGVTFGTRTNRAATAVTTGNDHRHTVDTFAAISSTSDVDAAPTWAYTASADASAGGVIVRLREYTAAIVNEVYVATSANVTAGGEATTAQLSAPSGKSTSDFVTGRMWDNENGTDSIDITADDYTELEWCLQAQSPAVNTDYFDFRVYAGGSALASYTVTPRWTLGTGGAYSLALAQGTYTLTGQAVATRAARKMAAAQGSYSLTGQAVTLTYGAAAKVIGIGQGTYSLTGQAVALRVARTLAAAQGSYALTGQAVGTKYGRKMAAAQGAYALTGQTVGLKGGRKIAIGQGTYAFTGSNALADYAITIGSGTYALTGQNVTLTYGATAASIAIGQGTYTLSGQAVAVRAARRLALAQGTYSLTGQAAGLKYGRKLAAGQGSYSLTGQTVAFRGARRLALAQGAYALTGQAVAMRTARKLAAGSGTYSATGYDVSLTYSGAGDKTIAIGAGSYALTGQVVGLRAARKLAAAFGSYAVTGQAIGLRGGRKVATAQGSYSLTGQAVGFARTRVLAAAAGAYSLSGQVVGVRSARRVSISAGGYTLTGQALGLSVVHRLALAWGTYSLAGQSAGLRATRRLAAASGSYSLAGQATAFFYSGTATPISTFRTYIVRREDRVLVVAAENRTYGVRAELRTWGIT